MYGEPYCENEQYGEKSMIYKELKHISMKFCAKLQNISGICKYLHNYLLLFLLLHSLQSIWQLEAIVRPPSTQGVI